MKIKIHNGRSYFYQWDSKQKLIIEDDHVNELHFTNDSQEESIVVRCYEENGIKYCDIPDFLLETAGVLTIYACIAGNGRYTKESFEIDVIERKKFADEN